MSLKIFAVYLGGQAPKGNIELHDVVFVTGTAIESTYEQLMDKWFGTPVGLHIDSWVELDLVDGHKIALSPQEPANGKKLFFINLGAYTEGVFGESHAIKFLVAENPAEAKIRGKVLLAKALPQPAHTDNLYDIDDCIEVRASGGAHIHLHPTHEREKLSPTNGYHLVPKAIVKDYMIRKGLV